MLREEIVTRRSWLTDAYFLDLMAAAILISGPNSTEKVIHAGFRRAGLRGLVAAGACFILLATLIILGFAWIYKQYGTTPQLESFLYGVKPVVIAVVVQAVWGLGRTISNQVPHVAVSVVAFALSLAGVNELAVLIGFGVAVMAARVLSTRGAGACCSSHQQHETCCTGRPTSQLPSRPPRTHTRHFRHFPACLHPGWFHSTLRPGAPFISVGGRVSGRRQRRRRRHDGLSDRRPRASDARGFDHHRSCPTRGPSPHPLPSQLGLADCRGRCAGSSLAASRVLIVHQNFMDSRLESHGSMRWPSTKSRFRNMYELTRIPRLG
jgi:chromate transport protein ChrA